MRFVLQIVTCECLIVVAGVLQQVRYVLSEEGMEQQLAGFEKCLISFSNHNVPNEEGRAQSMEVLTD